MKKTKMKTITSLFICLCIIAGSLTVIADENEEKLQAIMELNANGPYGCVENLYRIFELESHELYPFVDKDIIAGYLCTPYEPDVEMMYEILVEALCIGAYSQGVEKITESGRLSYTDVVGIELESTYEDYLSQLSVIGVNEVHRAVLSSGITYDNARQIRDVFSQSVLVNLITNNYIAGYGHVGIVFKKYKEEFNMYGLDTEYINSVSSPVYKYMVYKELASSDAKTLEDLIDEYRYAVKKAQMQLSSGGGGGGGVGGGSSDTPSYDVTYEKSDDGSIINVDCENVSSDSLSLVVAFYRMGKLVDICVSDNKSREFTTNVPYDTEKVMVLDSLQGMKPLVSSENIKDITDYSNPNNYAYVLDVAFVVDFSQTWQMKILTKDNEVVIYTVCSEIIADGEILSTDTEDCEFLERFVSVTDESGADVDKGSHRLILYTLDSKNRISEIYTIEGTHFGSKNYDGYEKTLGDNIDLSRKTSVFNIASEKNDDYFATNLTGLSWKDVYSGYYIANEEEINDCLIITAVNSPGDYTQNIRIVSSVGDLNGETQQEAKRVNYYTGSDKVSEYKIDLDIRVDLDNDNHDFKVVENQSVFSEYTIINATDAIVTPVETDGKEYTGVSEDKTDVPFTIDVINMDISFITQSLH